MKILTLDEFKDTLINYNWNFEETYTVENPYYNIILEKISGFNSEDDSDLEIQVYIENSQYELHLHCFNVTKDTISNENIINIQYNILLANLEILAEVITSYNNKLYKSVKDDIKGMKS